eukprot:5941883-Amphidinium_carterae.1
MGAQAKDLCWRGGAAAHNGRRLWGYLHTSMAFLRQGDRQTRLATEPCLSILNAAKYVESSLHRSNV